MMSKKLLGVLSGVLVLGLSTVAWAGIPNVDNSTAVTAAGQQVSVLICPFGDGGRLDAAQGCDGTTVNATITLTVLDINFDPVVGYPPEDLWIVANTICLCPDGSIADGPTDGAGQTTFTGALEAGGCSNDNSTNIFINPHGVLSQPGLPIWFNSPDMDCNLVVNLSDVVVFASIFFGGYDYCADFYCDGVINLSDVVVFTPHVGHSCP
jgi:hypothetical protein